MTTVLNFKAATAANSGPRSADTDAPINNGATSLDGEFETRCVALVWLERFNEDRSRKLVAVLLVAWTAMISRRLRTRPHSPQDAILDDVVMEKRRSGVKQHHRDNDICYDAMPCIDAAHEIFITQPRKVPQVKQRKRVCEHVSDAECDHDQQQQVQQPMRRHCEQMTHATFGRRQSATANRTPNHPRRPLLWQA